MSGEHIELNLPMDTPLEEVMDAWITAVVGRTGTQLRAAFNLHITPETISRRLNRHRKRLGRQQNQGGDQPASEGSL